MFKLPIEFIALKTSIAFEIESKNKEALDIFLNDLFSIFLIDGQDYKMNGFQYNSESFLDSMKIFTDKYKTKIPKLNAVLAFFNKLEVDQPFFFLPNMKIETRKRLLLHNYLKSIATGEDFKTKEAQIDGLFGELLNKYSVSAKGDSSLKIGEKNKRNRICRFCGLGMPDVTFESKAHAISEALGNKNIILLEECDKCNKEFSKNTESDIIHYLSLFRTIFGVKGKKGKKKMKGSNFEIFQDESFTMRIEDKSNEPEFSTPSKFKLDTYEKIVSQNIYKSLCKYFLSVIDSKYLPSFENTIKWINNDLTVQELPKIAELMSYESFSLHPKIITYIRKSEDKNIPYAVGEFYFTCKIFVFIIPLFDNAEQRFLKRSEYETFWNEFNHFSKVKGWHFSDYSDLKKRKFLINLNIEKREN